MSFLLPTPAHSNLIHPLRQVHAQPHSLSAPSRTTPDLLLPPMPLDCCHCRCRPSSASLAQALPHPTSSFPRHRPSSTSPRHHVELRLAARFVASWSIRPRQRLLEHLLGETKVRRRCLAPLCHRNIAAPSVIANRADGTSLSVASHPSSFTFLPPGWIRLSLSLPTAGEPSHIIPFPWSLVSPARSFSSKGVTMCVVATK
jgi:hypothetical protein